jgi:hypothetical protein
MKSVVASVLAGPGVVPCSRSHASRVEDGALTVSNPAVGAADPLRKAKDGRSIDDEKVT